MIPALVRSAGDGIGSPLQYSWASLVAQLVKNPSAMQVTWVQSLGWEDPWRMERLPSPVFWSGEFHGLYSPWGHKESDATEQFSLHFFTVPYNKCLSKTIIKNMQIDLIMLAFLG